MVATEVTLVAPAPTCGTASAHVRRHMPYKIALPRSAIGGAHFDTRQYNHIVWNDPAELRNKLANRIGALIGDRPLKS
jgi:hypothetical protein